MTKEWVIALTNPIHHALPFQSVNLLKRTPERSGAKDWIVALTKWPEIVKAPLFWLLGSIWVTRCFSLEHSQKGKEMDLHRQARCIQPPLQPSNATLTVVIAGMALGGAEWIVSDWLSRIAKRRPLHLVLLRNQSIEWPLPKGVIVTRLNGQAVLEKLAIIGQSLAASGNPTCLAHLVSREEQSALEQGGAFVYQVFHNARSGWLNEPSELDRTKPVIAVSHACKRDLITAGWQGDISVIHHLPRSRAYRADAREYWRSQWRIPVDARVIGMIGSFKPQKNYGYALRLLRQLLDQGEEYYLAILGGLVGSKDPDEWRRVRALVDELNLRHRVAMPGPVIDAVQCTPAFDIFLNTSHYEGLSIATLEILTAGIPAVVSNVGGQGEVEHAGLTLVDKQASPDVWCEAIRNAPATSGIIPTWNRFPSYRLWTLHHLTRPFDPSDRVLIVTANLNSGGAQRSLVNLVCGLNDERVAVAVTGESTVSDFYRQLVDAGVSVFRSAPTGDPFDNAETIIEYTVQQSIGTIVYWNADAKLKLLLGKALSHTKVRFIDVSPGEYAFESMQQADEFGRRICYTHLDFYRRLDDLVLKFNGNAPNLFSGRVSVIPNGVSVPTCEKREYRSTAIPKIAVCGRIAPSKFLLEIVEAMARVRDVYPNAELHVYGDSRALDQGYLEEVRARAGRHTIFHGPDFDARERYCEHDVFVTLGIHQGCPNAILEALSVGMPVVANDDGGTREQIIDGVTGRLTASVSPEEVSMAILSLLTHPDQTRAMGRAGRRHVLDRFSMQNMVERYQHLLWGMQILQQMTA